MNNFGFKILALCLASLLWIAIINIDDPVDTKMFNNIEVIVYNEEAIKSLDQVYEIVSGATVNVKVKAKKSVLHRMKAEDIQVMADLSEVLPTHAVPIKLTCPKFENSENIELSSNIEVLKISLEDIATEQFKVVVDTSSSSIVSGYAIGDIKVKPNLIKVSGPKSQINRISEVRAEIDVSNYTESFSKVVEPRVYDANGKLMDTSKMDFSTDELRVVVEILETKVIPITVKANGTPAVGYQFEYVDYQPKQIEIAGSAENLSKIDELVIEMDINNKSADIEEEVKIENRLPKGIILVGDIETVTIRVNITKQEEKEITFLTSDIGIKNLRENYEIEFIDIDVPLTVKVMGDKEIIENMTIASLGPYLDLKGIKKGEHTLEIQFVESDIVTITSAPVIQINYKRKQNQNNEENNENNNNETVGENENTSPTPLATEKPTSEPVVTKEPNVEDDEEVDDNTSDTP